MLEASDESITRMPSKQQDIDTNVVSALASKVDLIIAFKFAPKPPILL